MMNVHSNLDFVMKNLSRADDQTLLRAIALADLKVIRELYRRYLPSIITYIKHNQGTEADAYALFREALTVLFRKVKRGKMSMPASLDQYIAGICRYQWLARQTATATPSEKAPMEIIGHLDYVAPDSQTVGFIHETRQKQLFRHAFSQLGERCQELLSLYYQKNAIAEIADLLGTSEAEALKQKDLCTSQLFESLSRR